MSKEEILINAGIPADILPKIIIGQCKINSSSTSINSISFVDIVYGKKNDRDSAAAVLVKEGFKIMLFNDIYELPGLTISKKENL